MLRVAQHPKFKKRLSRLSPHIRNAFADRFEMFLINPRHPMLNNHPLSGNRAGFRSINITGDWRLIYRYIEDDFVLLTEIDTHHNLYGT